MNVEEIKLKLAKLKSSYNTSKELEAYIKQNRQEIITMLDINVDIKNRFKNVKIIENLLLGLVIVNLLSGGFIYAILLVLLALNYHKNISDIKIKQKKNMFASKNHTNPSLFLLTSSQNRLKYNFECVNEELRQIAEEKNRLFNELNIIFEFCLERYPCDKKVAIQTGKIIDDIGQLLGYEEAPFIDEQHIRVKRG